MCLPLGAGSLYLRFMMFWLAVILISLLCSFFLWRTWKSNLDVEYVETSSDLALARIRLKEIEQDLAEGRMDEESALAAKAEEARRLVKGSSAQAGASSAKRPNQPSGWWMTSALTLVPTLSIALYLVLGTPPSTIQDEPQRAQLEEQTLEQLVLTAERRLESEPDDLQGWQVLAPVYLRQNDLERAENALRNIIRLNGANSLTFSTLGEILVSRTNGEVRQEALQLFREAVMQDKQNATARYYLGLSALQNGALDEARQSWQSMLNDANGDEEWLPSIRQRLASLEEATVDPKAPPSPQEEILQLSSDEQRARIEGMVESLADRLADDPEDQDGWQRLVRAYKVLGMDERAKSAVLAATQAHREDDVFLKSLSLILENQKAMDTPQ